MSPRSFERDPAGRAGRSDAVLCGNGLLASLPLAARDRIAGLATIVPLTARGFVFRHGDRANRLVFPLSGIASVLVRTASGREVEVALVGCEGAVGLPLVLGEGDMNVDVMVQATGAALTLPGAAALRMLDDDADLRRTMLRYVQATLAYVQLTAVCHRMHPLLARLPRWLLMCHDRLQTDEFAMTHEFLAHMLGVRRAGVTVAAETLHDQGVIGAPAVRLRTDVRGVVRMIGGPLSGTPRRLSPMNLSSASPARDPAWHDDAADPHEPMHAQRVPVLVVDDDPETAESCATLLRLFGYDAREVTDPTVALGMAVAMRARAALIDIQMPGMNGLELARLFRRHASLHDIALIAVSGWGRPFDRQRTLAAGFDVHLIKPVEPDQLLAVLQQVASGRKTGPQRPS